MIKKAQENDIRGLQELYAKTYSPQFVAHYFTSVFKPFNTYVIKDNTAIVSTLAVHRHPVWLNGKKINVSYLNFLFTAYEYRSLNYTETMISEVMEEMIYNDLLTFISCADAQPFISWDFHNIYQRKSYLLSRNQLPVYSQFGITADVPIGELTNLYQHFMCYFDGYRHRDKDYYQNKLQEISATGRKLIGCFNRQNDLEGYLIYDPKTDPLEIKEIIYLNSGALLKLLSYVLNQARVIKFTLSAGENLARIIPTAIYNTNDQLMVRMNDLELFNRLYGSDIKSVSEAFRMSGKPVNFNEEY
ncbi:hypothetical protein SDC9_93026 [bioreactor metagenome]|uniref:Eis-like acetyltransferase domain-containing protein n=1 Tax=bioreactor metagenome TaxID=1076179 RepID=A0A645A0Q8_9ZZZZ|nr:GNAT family N-acetyltransferase [Erysipelotrichaceae bacterium]